MNEGYLTQCTSDTYCPIVFVQEEDDLLYPYVVVTKLSTSDYVVNLYINVSSECSIHTALHNTYSDLQWLNLLTSHQIRMLENDVSIGLKVGVNVVAIRSISLMGRKNVSLSFILKHQNQEESKVYKIHLHELINYFFPVHPWVNNGANTEPTLTYDGIYYG